MDADGEAPALSSMGRGRGRGGVPVLPAGIHMHYSLLTCFTHSRYFDLLLFTKLEKCMPSRLYPSIVWHKNHMWRWFISGLWGALNNSSTGDLQTLETIAPAPKKPTIVVVDVSEEIPREFGRGRGRGFGGRNAGMIQRAMNQNIYLMVIITTLEEPKKV